MPARLRASMEFGPTRTGVRMNPSRRSFLRVSGALAAAALTPRLRAAAPGANSDVRLLVVGCNRQSELRTGQGTAHLRRILRGEVPHARLAGVCDVDPANLAYHRAELEKRGLTAFYSDDFRQAVERDDVDGVIIATPNHLHTLVALWALRAGKHVYVEKPVSHNLREGERLVRAAAARPRLIVQHGQQRRSEPAWDQARDWARSGELGRLVASIGQNYKKRPSIGKLAAPAAPPPGVNHDLWCGPRTPGPVRRESYHYDWHWQWAYGNGDIGNQGPHQLDCALWLLGRTDLPRGVISLGGRFGYADDGETPNTQLAAYDYPDAPVLFDNRGLPHRNLDWKTDPAGLGGVRIGNLLRFERGWFAEGQILDPGGKAMTDAAGARRRIPVGEGREHLPNFVRSILAGKLVHDHLHVAHGHRSAALAHLANLSYRLGKTLPAAEIRDRLRGQDDALALLESLEKHLQDNGLPPGQHPFTCGPWLGFDPATLRFTGPFAAEANALAEEDEYRPGFELPNIT
jgi:predicted dehydrogenase